MYTKLYSSSLFGIDAYIVEIEIQFERALPCFGIVGLPDATVKESRERVKAAIINSSLSFPVKKITVNLAPASIKKEGSNFDLPIAIGVLSCAGLLDYRNFKDTIFIGELSFEGKLRPVKGIISIVLAAKNKGFKNIILPKKNAEQAAIINGINVYGFNDLNSVLSFLTKEKANILPFKRKMPNFNNSSYGLDFKDVKGQSYVKRGLLISAAGNHNILLVGPPGSGKTMLAKRLSTILPPLSLDEAIEITRIHSIINNPSNLALKTTRPFRNPHHTSSDASIIGGGIIPRPGEVSLAHRGVLFLDEFTEFKRNVLNTLRQPMEDNVVTISRAERTLTFPSDFLLVAAMNPCPCGYYGHPEVRCKCSEDKIRKYVSKISGPILDRIDIQIDVPRITFEEMDRAPITDTSEQMLEKVMVAKNIQYKRFKEHVILTNNSMPRSLIETYCKIDKESKKILQIAMDRLGMSARAHDKVLRVARTIADLEQRENISKQDVMEAIQFRSIDRILK